MAPHLKDGGFQMLRRTVMLLSVCIVLFVVLQFTDRMVYIALTQEHPLPPVIAGLISLILQGTAIFLVSFLIIRKKKYDKRYWIPSLLIVLMIHSTSNPGSYHDHSSAMYSLYIVLTLLTGIFSIFLSTRLRAGRR